MRKLEEALEISSMHMWRVAHGQALPGRGLCLKIEALSRRLKVACPIPMDSDRPEKPDTWLLARLGEAMEKGVYPKRAIEHARQVYTTDQLIELAETETSTSILRAVTYLLECE